MNGQTAAVGWHLTPGGIGRAGLEVVTRPGPDAMKLWTAIGNIVYPPDVMIAGRSRTFTANAGEATLAIEVRDSETNELLAQLLDRRETQSGPDRPGCRGSPAAVPDLVGGDGPGRPDAAKPFAHPRSAHARAMARPAGDFMNGMSRGCAGLIPGVRTEAATTGSPRHPRRGCRTPPRGVPRVDDRRVLNGPSGVLRLHPGATCRSATARHLRRFRHWTGLASGIAAATRWQSPATPTHR